MPGLAPCGRDRGYLLTELAIVLLVLMLGAVWLATQTAQETEDAGARATAALLLVARGRTQEWQLQHLDWMLAEPSGVPPAGLAQVAWPVDLPLAALSRGGDDMTLRARPVYGGELRVRFWREGQCPGQDCRPQAMVYTRDPIQRTSAEGYSVALVGQILMATEGFGAHAPPGAPHRLRGAVLDAANPMGARTGIVAVAASLDATPFGQFVRHGDTRPVRLRHDLTVGGSIATAQGVRFDTAVQPGQACAREGLHARAANGSLVVCTTGIWFALNRYVVTSMQGSLPHGAAVPLATCPPPLQAFTRVGLDALDVRVGGQDIGVRGNLTGQVVGAGAVSQSGSVSVSGSLSGQLRSTGDSWLRVAQPGPRVSQGRLDLGSAGEGARGYVIVGCRHGDE